MNVQDIILQQLGGRRFIAMTGSKDFLAADKTSSNPYPYLRMTLTRNKAGVNRLKISLMPSDTYKLEFYKQTLDKKTYEFKISKEQTFDNVYADQLQSIFTEVTGLYTHL